MDHPSATPEVDQCNQVVNVSESVSHPNRQLDFVIGSFNPGVGDLVRHGRNDRIHVTPNLSLELNEFRNSTGPGATAPFLHSGPNFICGEMKDCP